METICDISAHRPPWALGRLAGERAAEDLFTQKASFD
jgi:hypothetical protein